MLTHLVFLLSSLTPCYEIDAHINPRTNTISGKSLILIRNYTSETLFSLRFFLYPNAFKSRNTELAKELEQTGKFDFARMGKDGLGGITIEEVKSAGTPSPFSIQKTEMELFLPHPLFPKDSIVIEITFTTRLPGLILKLGRKGKTFVLTHWFPQLYTPTHQLAFGDYLISLHLPPTFSLAATGQPLSHGDSSPLKFYAENVQDFGVVIGSQFLRLSDSSATPRINLLLSRSLAFRASEILAYARLGLTFFTRWFGPYPFPELTIVDVAGSASTEISAPGLVFLTQKPTPFTRLFERHLITEIARQWFCQAVAPDERMDPALGYGLATYAAMRYLETLYGTENILSLPITIPFLSKFSDHYFHEIYNYLLITNHLVGNGPKTEERKVVPRLPSPVSDGLASRTALILKVIENKFGPALLDSAIRHYLTLFRGKHPTISDFLTCLSEYIGPKNDAFIDRLFFQKNNTDIAITRIKQRPNQVHISIQEKNPPGLPLTVKTVFSDGSVRIDTVTSAPQTTLTFYTTKKLKMVVVNPERKVLEVNRWNNFYPRRLTIHPLFALPDFESYQIFYGPWFWYDNYRGFQPGIWFQGRKLFDAGFLRGEHQWTLIENYATNKCDWHTGISYQTPLIFYPCRLRIFFTGDNSFRDRGFRVYFNGEFGEPFRSSRTEINLGYRFYQLLDTVGRDARAWTKAHTGEIKFTWGNWSENRLFQTKHRFTFSQALKPFLSQYQYSKISIEENCTIFIPEFIPVYLRLFIGFISGTAPPQEEFYLSGGLTYTPAEPVSWAYEGVASGQEHWHYDGDANCRGYYGLYRHGRYAYSINLHFLPLKYLQPFFDLGNVSGTLAQPSLFRPVFDAGIRLKYGPFYVDFPIWKSHPEENESHVSFRWSVGFKLFEPLGEF